MKVILLVIGVCFCSIVAEAQTTVRIDRRQWNQRVRIRQGIRSEEITRPEAVRLRMLQGNIRRTERRVKADGFVSRGERIRIYRQLDRSHRVIRRQRLE